MNPDLREQVKQVDEQITRLMEQRADLVLSASKEDQADLAVVSAGVTSSIPSDSLQAVFAEIRSAVTKMGLDPAIAYLGPEATFTHRAARERFGHSVTYLPCETINDVFAAVEASKADFGVAPVENSTEGAVTHTLDRFMDTDLKICAEVYLPISHNVFSKGDNASIKTLYSHPNVFGQCRRWLLKNMPGVDLVPVSSTARAAELAAEQPGCGAIAGRLVEEIYDLALLHEDIQDISGNTTRFLVVAPRYGKPTGHDKTSILFAVKHKVGALYDALESFKHYSLNMSRIESRPSRQRAWEYCFFVDFDGHADDAAIQEALKALSEHCTMLKVLGSYPDEKIADERKDDL